MDNGTGKAFIPNRPATVELVFDHFEVATTRDGDEKPVAVGDIDGVERSVWLLSTALRSQFRRLDPKQGETVLIEYAGVKTKSGNGRSYWDDKASIPDRPVEQVTVAHPLFKDGEEVDDYGNRITF